MLSLITRSARRRKIPPEPSPSGDCFGAPETETETETETIYLSIYLSIIIYQSLSIYHYLSITIYLSIYLSIYLFIYLYLSIYLSIHPSIYLSVCVASSLQKDPPWPSQSPPLSLLGLQDRAGHFPVACSGMSNRDRNQLYRIS